MSGAPLAEAAIQTLKVGASISKEEQMSRYIGGL